MNVRPRCRQWLPLITQQLRLRNLVRIQGLNIECSSTNEANIYYTLHHTKDGAAFYVSEALPRRKHLQQKWAEIACPEILKSTANCVCVKVWMRLDDISMQEAITHQSMPESKEPISALSQNLTRTTTACLSPNKLPRPPDKLLFSWGVYFSGLILLSQQTDAKCGANSLIFQMNGAYFASPEHFTADSLREQLSLNYQRYSASVPKISQEEMPDEFSINSPQVSRSSSPVQTRDLLGMSKARYVQLNCVRADIRQSYDLNKLLEIQELQRLHLQKMRESKEISSEVNQLSVHCITKEHLLQRRQRTTSSSSSANSYYHHSMGRTLSVLLAEQQIIDPQTLLRSQVLQQQVETLRCKQRLLQSEHDTYTERIKQLRQHLAEMAIISQERQSKLLELDQQLQADKVQLDELYQYQLTQRQTKRHIVQNVERLMSSLCMELREIYPIARNQHGFHTVCGIFFPNMEAYVNDSKYANSVSLENVSPMALSASLGYIAHLVQMIAVIINRPLRNPILHEGSRTRIMDIVKEIPYASREFPLYTRSTIPSKPVKYAIYLLNQNIAQLCYDITGVRCDLRATIENILSIFTTLEQIEQNSGEIHPTTQTHTSNRLMLRSIENGSVGGSSTHHTVDCLSKSHSSVDMNHDVQPPRTMATTKLSSLLQMPISSQALPIVERNSLQPRCRSVGSYSDCEDDFKDIVDHHYSNSDSKLTFQSEHI